MSPRVPHWFRGLTVTTLACLILLSTGRFASAQTVIYHLHREASVTPGLLLMKQGAPDAAATALQTIDLKNQGVGEYALKEFDTAANDPNVTGSLASGASYTFTLWMKRTSNFGTLLPRARIRLNSAAGPLLCQATGSTAVPSKLAAFTLACSTSSAVTITPTDRLYVWVGVWVTATAGNHSQRAELDIEGASNGNYDSRVTVPLPPTITSISPSSAPVGTSVTIAGSGFGASAGSSVASFNNTTAATTAWTSTSIQATVPSAASSGPVTVTVGGARSAGYPFTVQAPTIYALEPMSGAPGTVVTLTGSGFETQQGASSVTVGGVAASPTIWNDNRIVFSVPTLAISGPVVVSVNGKPSAGVTFSVTPPPAVTSLAPASGLPGSLVSIAGTNLSTAGTVTFAGVPASVKSWTTTGIVAAVPQTAASGNVVVDVFGVRSNGMPFAVSPAPVITALTPAVGAAGQTVAVSGSAFGASEGISTVTFNGLLARVNSWSDTALSVVVPRDTSTGQVNVRVAGRPSNNVPFSVPTGTLAGTVTRLSDGAPIAGAAVLAQASTTSSRTASTSRDGSFVLPLPPGTYSVQAFAAGHQSNTVPAQSVQAGITTNLPIVLAASPDAASVLYQYDAGDRLVGVVDPAGASAAYRYDAVGNIVGIERAGSGRVTITSVTPLQGPPGTAVTVTGTSFDASVAQNAVALGGRAATVTSASPTQLTFLVPPTAATGTVSVTTSAGSATSVTPFVVTASSGAPTVSAVTPTTASATQAVMIAGTNFSTAVGGNRVTVNGVLAPLTSVTPTSLGIVVPTIMGGRVSVETSLGAAANRPDLYVTPRQPSFYAVADVAWTGRTTMNASVPISIGTAGKIGLLLVDGNEGEGLSLRVSGSTIASAHYWVHAPDGTIIRDGSSYLPDGTGYIDSVALPRTGTYTIAIAPSSPYVGTLSLTPVRDVSGPIVPNSGLTPVTIASPGQNARFTFTGVAGTVVSAFAQGFSGCSDFGLSILKPDGTTLASSGASCMPSAFIEASLPATGTYTVVFDPAYAALGTATLGVYTFDDVVGAITPNGPAVPVATQYPGQNVRLQFTGTAGQVVTASASNLSWSGCLGFLLSILKPDGTAVSTSPYCFTGGTLSGVTLLSSGTHTLLFSPEGAFTGTASLRLTTP